jgi:hypothetical protein
MTPSEKSIKTVMGALESEETVVPGLATCRAMLVAAAPAALKVPKEERHENQHAVVHMLREIFENEKCRWTLRVQDADSALEKATAERTEKVSLKDAAEAELKEQKVAVEATVVADSTAMEVMNECQEELSLAQKQLKKVQSAKDRLVETYEHDLSVQETINGLKEGRFENPKDVKTNIKTVTALFESLEVEEALVKTLPQILRSRPEDRGSFDVRALEQLDVYMNDHLSSLSSKIEDANKTVEEHKVAEVAWSAALDVAQDKKRERGEEIEAATARQENLQEALNGARKVLKEHTAVVKSRSGDLATEQCGLHVNQEVLDALEFLQEYVVPEPEEDTKEPQEVATDSAEIINTEVPAEMSMDVVVPASKTKDVDMALNFAEVPSPTKKARHSLGDVPMVVA